VRSVAALELDLREARSFLEAVDVASDGAVALDLVSFGRRGMDTW